MYKRYAIKYITILTCLQCLRARRGPRGWRRETGKSIFTENITQSTLTQLGTPTVSPPETKPSPQSDEWIGRSKLGKNSVDLSSSRVVAIRGFIWPVKTVEDFHWLWAILCWCWGIILHLEHLKETLCNGWIITCQNGLGGSEFVWQIKSITRVSFLPLLEVERCLPKILPDSATPKTLFPFLSLTNN